MGGGSITRALVAGMRAAGDRSSIVVFDRHPEKLRALRKEFGIEVARDLDAVVQAGSLLLIAVRPSSCMALLHEIADKLDTGGKPLLAVSLAAGIPLAQLRRGLKTPVRWARAMPSPVASIGCGLTAVCFERALPTAERERVRRLFAKVGEVVEIPERQFDAFTVAYSPSHGYHALATLAQAAQAAGLDRKTALAVAAHAVGDAITHWRETGSPDPQKLLVEAATPGGTAEATIGAMSRAGYEKIAARGLRAGMARARKNAELARN